MPECGTSEIMQLFAGRVCGLISHRFEDFCSFTGSFPLSLHSASVFFASEGLRPFCSFFLRAPDESQSRRCTGITSRKAREFFSYREAPTAAVAAAVDEMPARIIGLSVTENERKTERKSDCNPNGTDPEAHSPDGSNPRQLNSAVEETQRERADIYKADTIDSLFFYCAYQTEIRSRSNSKLRALRHR